MRLTDEAIVVTGGSSGLGRTTAIAAANQGMRVVNADIRREPREDGDPTDEVISAAGGDALFVETDVTSLDDVVDAVEAAREAYGGLDVMVNNAGRAETHSLTDTDEANWRESIEVNLTGVYHGSLAAVQAMLKDGGGAIVNVASALGVTGSPNAASYSAAKGGVISLTRQVAYDHARHDIRANSVSPGFVDTPMLHDAHEGVVEYAIEETPMRRVGDSEEVAEAVVFLASDASSYVTGENLLVDGGFGM